MKKIFLFLLLLAATTSLFAQEPAMLLRHEMTPEEMLRKDEIGRGFVETLPPAGPVRNVAEFDRMQGALVRYTFGIPISLIKEMAEEVMVTTVVASTAQQNTVLSQYITNGVDTSHCDFLIAPSNSYWTRDYGPWFVTDSAGNTGIVDFPYNRPRPLDDEIPKLMADHLGIPWYGMNVIHTGGNYMTDGFGVGSSTDLVYVENPSQTQAEVDEKMEAYLGITNHQVVPDPNISSTIDHIDCWGKFLAPDKILIRQTLPSDPEYSALESAATYWAGQTCSYGYPYRVFRVKTPQDQPYSNSVILNNKVLVPFMNSPWDDSARAVYQAAMPGYEVIGFTGNPGTPWVSTDALHCRVMGIADIGLLHIRHLPLFGNQPCETDHTILADVINSSHQPVKPDSVLIRYRTNGGAWQVAPMEHLSGWQYRGFIPKQPAGSQVEYYLTAADESGRNASLPLVGAADPFVFHTVAINLTAMPDTLWFIDGNDCMYGKISQLKNQMGASVSLDYIQPEGVAWHWWVDSVSVASLPYSVNPGDSVAIRVKVDLPVFLYPGMQYLVDSLRVTTGAGSFHVIIMINTDLLSSAGVRLTREASLSCSPNPVVSETEFRVDAATPGTMLLEILDITGTCVRTIYHGNPGTGSQTYRWNGTDDRGRPLPPGIYLCRLTTPEKRETLRIALTN